MWCYRSRRWLSPYLDEELAPRRRARLERHLSACPACAHALEVLRDDWEQLGALDCPPPPTWLRPPSAITSETAILRRPGRLAYGAFIGVSAVLGIVLGVAVLLSDGPVDEDPPPAHLEQLAVVEAFGDPLALWDASSVALERGGCR